MVSETNQRKVTARLPNRTIERAENYVKDGGAVNISDLMRASLIEKLNREGY